MSEEMMVEESNNVAASAEVDPISEVVLAVIEGLTEHSALRLSRETIVSYVTSVTLLVVSAREAVGPVGQDEAALYYDIAFYRALRAIVAHHGVKWSAEQVLEGAESMAALTVACRETTIEALALHKQDEAKKKAQAEIASRVKSIAQRQQPQQKARPQQPQRRR